MAVDEALLAQAAVGELGPVLRFYQWSPATLSLGYFQRYVERARHPASAHCDVVRRASGGGAILHDRELTYSLVLPAGHPLAARPEPLYCAVHQALIEVLAGPSGSAGVMPSQQLDARFWDAVRLPRSSDEKLTTASEPYACGDTANRLLNLPIPLPQSQIPNPQSPPEPFLCFQRRSPGDLVLRARGDTASDPAAWHKILGSAQRRRHGAVLQHGSLLWACSAFAPELLGVSELAGTGFAPGPFPRLISTWSEKLAKVLSLQLSRRFTSPQVVNETTITLAREKFHEPSWLQGR